MTFPQFVPVSQWLNRDLAFPLLIAGPCSAESEEQMLATAKAIKSLGGIKIFRAGIWKPRTRPGSFEGFGEDALKWMQQVKTETGLYTITEVANPVHVEMAFRYGVDMLWIGARTVSNPFSVQELAEVLKGTDIPVFVKNPVTPDLSLWIGAIERFNKIGIHKMAAIHRGFYPYETTRLRNIPKWEIAIDLKSYFHDLPLLCDVSHIAGDRKYLAEVAQESLDLDFNGLMIETHIKPEEARSDASQQVNPEGLKELLNILVFRQSLTSNSEFNTRIDRFRRQIDSIDSQLIELLGQRMDIARQIGEYKQKNNVSIFQLRRWEKIISTRLRLGKKLKLDENFILKLLHLVHQESIKTQAEFMHKAKDS